MHVWSHSLDDVAHVARALRDSGAVDVVSPSELFRRINERVDRELHVRLARRRHRWPQSFLVLRWHRELRASNEECYTDLSFAKGDSQRLPGTWRRVSLVRCTSYSVVTCRGGRFESACAGQNVARRSSV